MVEKHYSWENGVKLEEHTRRKHKILQEYFARYLAVRCAFPQQTKFRLAILEGFAGGGRYDCGSPGSPLIFLEQLRIAAQGFNLKRQVDGMAPLDIECFMILNDAEPGTIDILKNHVEPVIAAARSEVPKLHLQVAYFAKPFEALYPEIKALLAQGRYQNVLFNLDQYGHSEVEAATIGDISASFSSAEVFYTFAISSLLAFLPKSNPALLAKHLSFLGVTPTDLSALERQMSKREWLGAAERLVFDTFRSCAHFVSPFSINNPGGWRYWLIHFANNNYRARQEYNNVLHQNASIQAHFGRSGLNMLSFDPANEGALYLFDLSGRERAKAQLMDDIPRLVTEFGDAVNVGQFYSSIYNMTPAHMEDIHAAMIENPDLEIVTEAGGERRKSNTIRPDDMLRMKMQRTMFPIFLHSNKDQ
jgi:three-Cys-motif partner protein